MSAGSISASAGVPPDELATTQRVQQLQTLIDQVCQTGVAAMAGSPAQTPTTDFASVLQAATAGSASGAQSQSTTQAEGSSSAYDPLIERAAARYGLDPAILHGLIQQESDFNPSSQSSAGAAGLTQLMPGTASSLGVANPLDPTESIEGGARYLSQLMSQFGGNTTDALAAYNAGPGAVSRYGGVPPYPETQDYVAKVLGYAESYRQAHGGSGGGGSLQYPAGAPPGVPPGGLAYEAGAAATYPARTATAEGQLKVTTPASSAQPSIGRPEVDESIPTQSATQTQSPTSTQSQTVGPLTALRPAHAQTPPAPAAVRMASAGTRISASSTGVSNQTPAILSTAAAPTEPAIEPSAPGLPSGGEASASLPAGVPMQDMIDSIRATVEIAARQGVSRARIELQPQELGHINIRLSQTSDGLRVRVSAETPAGAEVLAQGRGELRQSLSSLGISLLALDIGSSGQWQAHEQGERSTASAAAGTTKAVAAAANETLDRPETTSPPPGPALGEIVDVLA